MSLTVPKQYKLLNYQPIDSAFIRHDYTTYKLPRALRVGAEDELIKLEEPSVSITPETTEKPIIINPTVPSSLIQAPIYHPLTVFVRIENATLFCFILVLHLESNTRSY